MLDRGLEAAARGEGSCAVLTGEPGIGKSRLAHEVIGRASARGLRIATGRAVPGAAGAAYRPLTEVLLQLVQDGSALVDPELRPWLGALGPLLGPGVSAAGPPSEVSFATRGESVLQLLKATGASALVVVLEDLHWADADTVAVAEYVADHLERLPLLFVMTLRDGSPSNALEMVLRHRGAERFHWLALGRLGDGETAAMARACRPDISDDDLVRVQRTAEGIPLLVEDLLASPGVPDSFAATVTSRLGELEAAEGEVLQAAAVLGRRFDWELLPSITGKDEHTVARALASGTASQLLTNQGGELRFRHALTREAVVDSMLPPRQREIASRALRALVSSAPLDGPAREVAIDLAVRAGDRWQAGAWLIESGRDAIGRGALASGADAMRRAAQLLAGYGEQSEAELGLIQALALAGRVEEAAATGGRMLSRLADDERPALTRLEGHLLLAHAAVSAARWEMARLQLDAARALAPAGHPDIAARIAVLDADVSIADDDYGAARRMIEGVIGDDRVRPETRCHALEILGRTLRSAHLLDARQAFERALVTAETAGLTIWRMRALHELGTIDLFDHAGIERLLQARDEASRAGALGTAAVLDLQLAAAFTCRWDLEACDAHAHSAIALAERLGLDLVRAKALVMLAGSAGMRADVEVAERYSAMGVAAAPQDRALEALCMIERASALLLGGDSDAAMGPYTRGMAILATLPHAEPAALRALWPLVLAARGDHRAEAAIEETERLGVGAFGLNRALMAYARAVIAGARGEPDRAVLLVAEADPGFVNCGAWADLARLLAARCALRDGWGDVRGWLSGASRRFAERGLPALAGQSDALLKDPGTNPWSKVGITAREGDVLRLVGAGLTNTEIATRLGISPRTVEKHVESLLRKSDSRSRTELATRLLAADSQPSLPGAT